MEFERLGRESSFRNIVVVESRGSSDILEVDLEFELRVFGLRLMCFLMGVSVVFLVG